ncbi:MAG: ankyrin repeat domain-containing protein [Burkholderiales bacterium]|nr:ankyrin repeat domain-containing protein [Burkholderiales bacterium]
MIRRTGALLLLALAVASCGVERPPYGGAPERELAAATLAGDTAAVTRLLAAGADPNKMVAVLDRPQSPWYIALLQLRPKRPESVAIIEAMLARGARPDKAWGTGGDATRPPESFWKKFMSGGRVAGTGDSRPLDIVMLHPVPEAVRALVAAGMDPRLGQRALVSAIETRDDEIARILVEGGVDVNCNPGPTPLVAAIETRNVAMMTLLEQRGARERP